MVAVAAQDWPATLVPCAEFLWLISVALTVLALVTVGVPMSSPNSAQAKLPSALANVDLNVMTPALVLGNVASMIWNQRWVEPAVAARSVSPTAGEPAVSPTPRRVEVLVAA